MVMKDVSLLFRLHFVVLRRTKDWNIEQPANDVGGDALKVAQAQQTTCRSSQCIIFSSQQTVLIVIPEV